MKYEHRTPNTYLFQRRPNEIPQEPWAVFYVICHWYPWSRGILPVRFLDIFFSWQHLGQSVTILVNDTGICHCFIHHGCAWALLCQLTSYTQIFFPRGRPGHPPWLSSATNSFSWCTSKMQFSLGISVGLSTKTPFHTKLPLCMYSSRNHLPAHLCNTALGSICISMVKHFPEAKNPGFPDLSHKLLSIQPAVCTYPVSRALTSDCQAAVAFCTKPHHSVKLPPMNSAGVRPQ